jgi:RNA polymerase sigma-70 factor (ECF subfamily)
MVCTENRPDLLLQRARAGEAEAIEQLLQQYGNYLQLLARTQIGSVLNGILNPSDLVQETMLEASQAFKEFRGETERELMAWLRKILVNTLVDYARHHHAQSRDLHRLQSLNAMLDHSSMAMEQVLAEEIPSPSQQASRREQAVIVADALAALPDDYREVVILRQFQQLKFLEIGTRMGRSAGAARVLWVRALERLRSILGESQ